jgi:capsular polysaccharide biosynthesis protein
MEEIDLKEIFNMFWSKKMQIFVIMLIFLIIGSVYTINFTTPVYSSSITLILVSSNKDENQNSTITANDITVNAKLIATYSELIKSKTVLQEVISNLNMPEDWETLKENITVSAVQKTELIKITAKDENAARSAQTVNEIAKVFSEKAKEFYNINNIQIMSNADIPNEPSNINHKMDIAIFTLAGFVIAAIYVVILNMLDNTIKTAESVENEFKLPVLASIPNYEKGGKK